jgi:hypothetical protein
MGILWPPGAIDYSVSLSLLIWKPKNIIRAKVLNTKRNNAIIYIYIYMTVGTSLKPNKRYNCIYMPHA